MRPRRARLATALLTVDTAVGFITAVTTTGASASAPAPALAWKPCAGVATFQCARLHVPLDYDSPRGPQINVQAIRHVATDPAHRIGSLFWNPGGPGGAGTTSLPLFYSSFPAALRARFDIISFDPRGIGASDPLRCFDSRRRENALLGRLPAGYPVGAAQERRQASVYAKFDAACARHGGPIQFHMSTANVARDMDRLRAAVGDRILDYYGTSYGTYLGVTYANLFPAHVGHIVLDGNAPPVEWNDATSAATANTFTRLQSPLGTELGLRLMLSQCGTVSPSRCAFSAGSAASTVAKYRTLLRRVTAAPVTLSGQKFTYAAVVSAVASGLIAQNVNPVTSSGWKQLANLLQSLWLRSAPGTTSAPVVDSTVTHAGEQRSPSALAAAPRTAAISAALPEGTDGVLCSESPNPRKATSYGRQSRNVNASQSPDGFGYVWTWLAQPCAQWRASDADRYAGPWNRSTKPYLVVGTLADSNTAYWESQKMSVELPNTRLLTETGGGHTALLNRSTCIDGYTSSYLISGALPPPGKVCNQDKSPF